MSIPSNKCLTKTCQRTATWKGLCPNCYKAAKDLVASGKVTWQELADLGLADVGQALGGEGSAFIRDFQERSQQHAHRDATE